MGDKTILVIFLGVNVLMWIAVLDWMRKTNKNYMGFLNACIKDITKATELASTTGKDITTAIHESERVIKNNEYYIDEIFKQLNNITDANANTMSNFLEKISVKITDKDNIENASENRK